MMRSDLARETLLALSAMQSKDDDPWRDAEPGKILHELRSGELAMSGLIPHSPYYGTVDATPLFVALVAAYFRWSADEEVVRALMPAVDAALTWIDRHGDLDGDGFVEYQRRSPGGLLNQGWKDSEDCIMHANGRLAEGPIALVEVQAYVYLAKSRIADVYDALGDRERGDRLRSEAKQLRTDFISAFWNDEDGCFVLALDGKKRQVRSVASNQGHCLYCGIVDQRRAKAVVQRLMADDMFSGWGIRTLSSESPAYNPMSYHNGSVWPHENALIAAGFKRYGYIKETHAVAEALFENAWNERDYRLREVYCGFERSGTPGPVAYPVACIPQAWATAAPFMLLQAMLGISARADLGTLGVHYPSLPSWLDYVVLKKISVGDASVSLTFHREQGVTAFSVLEQKGGDISVMMRG
jgi:glycogen debranching enzyme